ncbi:TIGR03016 family PEP-CTERM system-associated outer membrane protein [Parahaliea sp. F7430]|uniref:TIGR03016 family PEP-CTERM system-associated outer membrane protein n=1 Tax=Sediminihaliea albiluteola TaxID=2758564 RepID=A0A7W2TVI4_9GAMM|nr:TIGR03016 family PEP-CTERM system-associated outer membrane protein [Sediminihaliea albiluteola]MBA6412712.1 TIGR03016 family PEP-CTERM system-associated outer membrane protein [Sediminihaliea albiluteola]
MRKTPSAGLWRYIIVFPMTAVLSCSSLVSAAEWERSAGLSLGAIYSDNLCLSKENKESDVIATATPNVRLKATGARARIDLYAAAQFSTIENSDIDCGVGGSNSISPAPRIRFNGNAELLENWLYLDTTAFADQNRINPFAAGGEDALDGRNNLNTSYQYSVSPFVSRRLTPSSRLFLRYRYSEEFNSENQVNDNQRQEVDFDIGTSPELTRLSVGISAKYSDIDYDNREGGGDFFNSQLSSAQLRSAWQINRTWQINAYVGEEWNDYVTVFQDSDGGFWDVGVTWTPSTRVTVQAGTGERFFGSAPRASVEYRHKRSALRASYFRDLTYDRSLRGQDLFANNIDDLLDGGLPGQDEIFGPEGQQTTVSNSPILREQFLLSYHFGAQRTSFTVNASHSEQTRAVDGYKDSFIYAGVGATRQLSSKLSAYTHLSWNRRKPDEARSAVDRESDVARFILGLNRKIGQRTSLALSYQYSERSSKSALNEYEENRIVFQFRYQL